MVHFSGGLKRYLCFALLSAMVLHFGGCAGKKGAIKDGLAAATDEEKNSIALKLFKDGAELLFEDNNAALAKFDQARDLDKTLIAAHFNAGVALEGLGNLGDASLRYEACLEQDKQQASCLENLLLAKANNGEVEAAEMLAEQYMKEFPDAPFAMAAAAKVALFKKDYARAEKLARLAIEIEAENVESLYVMARIFFERKLFPAAKWVLKNALEIAPSHGSLHLTLGHTEAELGLLHDALDSYEQAVKAQPTEEALESYGLLLLKRGRVAEALPVLKRLAETRPEASRHHLHLGNAYMANKMFEEAKSAYLRAQELDADDFDVKFNLALLYFEIKPKDLAEIDRLKISKDYFESYLSKSGLSKERQTEVKTYLSVLTQKIEAEEYSAQSEKEAEEERVREQQENKADEKDGQVDEPDDPLNPEEPLPNSKKEEPKIDNKNKKGEPDGFDEEEFFND